MNNDEIFVVECYLRSRKFESKLEISLDATYEEKRQFIDIWMQMMVTGLGIKAKGPSASRIPVGKGEPT